DVEDVLQVAQAVGLADEPDELAVVDHRQAADLPLEHEMDGAPHRRFGSAGERARGHRQTVEKLLRTAELVAEIAPALWSVFLVVPVGRARLEQQLGPDASERVFHFLYEWSEWTGIAVKTTAAAGRRERREG